MKDLWVSVDHDLPVNDIDSFNGEVIGVIAPYGDLNQAVVDFVHFDGSDWYDRGCRTCTVTHWKPIDIGYLK